MTRDGEDVQPIDTGRATAPSAGADSQERLLAFFYVLMRDELPVGRIESVLVHHVELSPSITFRAYSNSYLEALAREFVGRLVGVKAGKKKEPATEATQRA